MIIGVTGGIASGKSEVCRILEKMGFIHIDADDVAHKVLEIPEIIDQITERFGSGVLNKDDASIDRKALGKIVFADASGMDDLEKITHPRVVQEIRQMISAKGNYVIEAIALVSSGMVNFCDELWVVHAEKEQQIERLMKSRALSYEDAIQRIKSQENHDWDESTADRIIYSTEPLETMEKQVRDALKCDMII